MYYTYVLRSKKDGKWYTGYAGDLRKRFRQHNAEEVRSTKDRGPFEPIYYEACLSKEDARCREKYLKSGMRKRYLKQIEALHISCGVTSLEIACAYVSVKRRGCRFIVFRISINGHASVSYL
jgi:putative endonuclease